MKQLIAYLRQNLILDFQGELTTEMVREFLKGDDSREAKTLLAKIVADGGSEEMLLAVADCLADPVRSAVTDPIFQEQLQVYSES